ncbi:hypothetical protein AX769_07380 [Frondihabitans sp. PAMC 28766]|uniref:nuclear transport factor 2 family protein n=1 Tax=Frondihabitans sp. PAMC 28766 TaxID=1795630 RepID=UPI00078C8F6C|nr:nuclear transport factor 2 family protein [Frondihabitans sp. PAMC 28766]AMM20018.1 hypothetical protein AX769_07380 [Frondihabitans sp. PAMC 28766]
MIDREGVRRTLALAGRYLDDRRFDEWSGLFAPDGVFHDGDADPVTGRDEILRRIRGGGLANDPELFRRHVTCNEIIDYDGYSARVESDLVIHERQGEGPWGLRLGRYSDVLEIVADQWLFRKRRITWVVNGL